MMSSKKVKVLLLGTHDSKQAGHIQSAFNNMSEKS